MGGDAGAIPAPRTLERGSAQLEVATDAGVLALSASSLALAFSRFFSSFGVSVAS